MSTLDLSTLSGIQTITYSTSQSITLNNTCNASSLTINVNTNVSVSLTGNNCVFNCPVTFNVLSSNSSNQGGICKLLGTMTFNKLTSINVTATTSLNHSYPARLPVLHFGDSSTAFNGVFRSEANTEVINIYGLGKIKVQNDSTTVIVELHSGKPGIYSQIQQNLFTVEGTAVIYASIGNNLSNDFIILTNCMVMEAPYKILFNESVTVKISLLGVVAQILVGLSTPVHVKIFDSSFFDTVDISVSDGSTINFESCDFLIDTESTYDSCVQIVTATNTTNYSGAYTHAVYFNKYRGDYTASDETSCVFNAIASKKILSANYPALVSVGANTEISLPDSNYTYSSDVVMPSVFVVNDTNFFESGFSTGHTYTIDLNARLQVLVNKSCNLYVTAHLGLTMLSTFNAQTASGTATFTSANLYSHDSNNNVALNIDSASPPFSIVWGCTPWFNIFSGHHFTNNLPTSTTTELRITANTVDSGKRYTTYGIWNFTTSTIQASEITLIANNGIIVNSDEASYNITADFNSTLSVRDDSDISSVDLYVHIVENSQLHVTANFAEFNLAGNLYTDYSLSCHFKTALRINYDDGLVQPLDSDSYHLNFHIKDSHCFPWLGNLTNSNCHTQITPVYGVSYAPSVSDPESPGEQFASWYGPKILCKNDSGSPVTYTFGSLNQAGINIWLDAEMITLSGSSIYRVKIHSDYNYSLASWSFGNSGDNCHSTLQISGLGNVGIGENVSFNVYGHGSITYSGVGSASVTRNSDPTMNYYHNSYDMENYYSNLEFAVSIHLKDDGDYTFTNVSADFTIRSANTVTANVIINNVEHQLNLHNNSSNLLTFTGSTFDVRSYYGLLAAGSGPILVTGDSVVFNTYSNSTATEQIIFAEGTGNLTLDAGNVIFNIMDYFPAFIIRSQKTGNAIINTADADMSLASHTPVYWESLPVCTAINPYVSTHNLKFAAYSWDPFTSISYTHNEGCAHSTSTTFALCGGNSSSTATYVDVSFHFDSYTANGHTYTQNLSDLITSDTTANDYIGSVEDHESSHRYDVSSSRFIKITFNIQDTGCTYVGNLSAAIYIEPENDTFGSFSGYRYSITDNVCFPEMTFCPTSITASNNSDSSQWLNFHLSKGFAFKWYIYPTLDTEDDTNGHYGVMSNILQYREKSDCTWVTYADYINYSTNSDVVAYFDVNSRCTRLKVKIPASTGEYFTDGLAGIFSGYFTRRHSEHYLAQSNELTINFDPSGSNYPYPILSLSASEITTDYSSNETIHPSDSGQLATINIGDSYNLTTLSYQFTMYFRTFIHTHSGNHSLTFTGDECYTSTISTDDGDLTITDNVITYSGTDTDSHKLIVNCTKNQALGAGGYTFGQELLYTFTLAETTSLSSPTGAIAGPFTVTGNTYFSIPQTFLVALGCVQSSTVVSLSSSTLCEHYDKGDNLPFTLFSVGDVADDVTFCYNVAATIQYGSISLMPYTGTGVMVGSSQNNATICSGHHRAEMNMNIVENFLITGRSHYTLSDAIITLDGDDISGDCTYPTITLRDNSKNHIVSFYSGFGSNLATNQTDLTSDCESQVPSAYAITPIQPAANAANLLMNIKVQTNSIPYWRCTGNHAGFRVHFKYVGNNTAPDDGDHNVDLCPGDEIYVYNNQNLTGSNNIRYVVVDDDTWNEGVTLYIQQGSTAYKYITLKYYVTKSGNNDVLNSDIDYSGLTTVDNLVNIITYDYSAAPLEEANYRSLNLGAWRFTVGALGELNIRYIGAESGQSTNLNFTLPPINTTASYPINYD